MNTMTVGFLIIVVVLFIAYRIFAPRIRGFLGENRIGRLLRRLPDEEHTVISDLMLWTSAGTTQIDHLVVSRSGIFVIETKNFSGWIHGNENSEYWTQTIFRVKTKFRNPVKQNWAHIYALKEVLSDLKHIDYHPIVVFAGSAELKNVYSRSPVIYDHELLRTIIDRCEGSNLNVDQIKQITQRLSGVSIRDRHLKREHVRRVQERTFHREQMERLGICPKCGGSSVFRNGRYGSFYGCSKYPSCMYTRPYRTR